MKQLVMDESRTDIAPGRVRCRVRALLVGAVLLGACGERPAAPVIGQPIPDFELPDLQGKAFRLSEQRGKVVLINFWASWCPPCVEEMPSLVRLHHALKEKGLEIVAISVDETVEDIEKFRTEHNLSFTVLHDKGAKVSHAYQTFKYPETYLVGRDGNLKWKIIGPRDWIAPSVLHELVELTKTTSKM